MRASFIKAWLQIQSSYYFVPALMGLGAVLLAFITTGLDLAFESEIEDWLGWFLASSVASSRTVLTTIAGSMISVAAVTFSLTMVAVTTAAGQFGPRLISNFMRDRANQITLGMFISTFLYCLVVLASVSQAVELDDRTVGLTPNLSVLVALLLTLISVGVLIFFVHHIPETLNVGNMTGKVAKEMSQQIEVGRFPATSGVDTASSEDLGDPFDPRFTQQVRSTTPGFVQAVSLRGLLTWTEENKARVRVTALPGHFLMRGDPVMEVIRDNETDVLGDEDRVALRSYVAYGRERTEHQNLLFLADELVEICARALSPGVNDPFTAVNCLHWFGNVCMSMMDAANAPDVLRDAAGTPRVWAEPVSAAKLISVMFGQSRQYVCEDENAAREALTILYRLQARAPDAGKDAVTEQLSAMHVAIAQSGLGDASKARLRGRMPFEY